MEAVLARFPLRWQLLLVGAAAVLGLFVAGALVLVFNWRQTGFVAEMERAADAAATAGHAAMEFSNARVAANLFLDERDTAQKSHVAASRGRAEAALSDLAKVSRDPRVAEAARRTSAWDAHFAKVAQGLEAAGLDEKSGLQGTMRKSVQAVEARLAEVTASSARGARRRPMRWRASTS